MVTLGYTMQEIETFGVERLKQVDVIDHNEVTIEDIEIGRDWGDAAAFLRVLIKYPELLDQTKSPPAVVERYWKLWTRAAFVVSPESLTDQNIDTLYQEHILDAFVHHQDPRTILEDHLKMRLYSQELVPKFTRILQALETNTQLIGTEPLKHQGKPVSPQVRWWLNEYRAANDRAGQRGGMEEATFLAKNHNAQLLKPEDRELLKKVIQFDDYLVYPVVVGDPKDWFFPKIIDDALKMEQFKAEQEKPEAVDSGQARMTTAPVVKDVAASAPIRHPGPDQDPIPTPTTDSGQVPPQRDPAAAVTRMTTSPIRPEPSKDDPITRIREMVSSGNFTPLLAGRPPTSQNLAAVLHEAYTRRAGLDDSQGAREAVHIANLLKKHGRPEFMNMAYFDATSGEFRWNE